MYSIDFPVIRKKICSRLDEVNRCLFVNGMKIFKFKAKDSAIALNPLCLGKISKDFSVNTMKKTRLIGYVYDFSVDYHDIAVNNLQDIYKYLMKKNGIIYNA